MPAKPPVLDSKSIPAIRDSGYVPPEEFKQYDPEKPVIDAAVEVAGHVSKGNKGKVVNQHQGGEDPMDVEELAEMGRYSAEFSNKYNKLHDVGGNPQVRETSAGFMKKFKGISFATAANTFLVKANGRNGLNATARLVNARYHSAKQFFLKAMTPLFQWPRLLPIFKMATIKGHKTFRAANNDSIEDNLTNAINAEDILDGDFDELNPLLSLVYLDLPRNPTGPNGKAGFLQKVVDRLDEINERRELAGLPPITLLLDMAYYAEFEQRAENDNSGSVLKTPYEGVHSKDGKTPIVCVLTFAKALANASPGGHIICFSDQKMAEMYRKMMNNDTGLSFEPEALAQMASMLDERNWGHLRKRFGNMARNYQGQYDAYEGTLSGDAGMMHLEELGKKPKDGEPDNRDLLNRIVEIPGHGRFPIVNAIDLASVKAHTIGVVNVVNDARDPETGDQFSALRVATKGSNFELARSGYERQQQLYDAIRSAPRIG